MNKVDTAVEKLQRIQELWLEIERTKADSPEYKVLVGKIRALSEEYQALTRALNEPQKRS